MKERKEVLNFGLTFPDHMLEFLIEEGEEERCKAYLIRGTTDMKTGKR